MTVLVGVDPGISGAVAVLRGMEVEFYDTPTLTLKTGKSIKHAIDAQACADLLRKIDPDFLVIEKVWAMPGAGGAAMGVSSAFNFGMGFGIWLGIIVALQIPHEQVPPNTWKKALMEGMGKEKDASRQRAMQLFPKTAKDLTRVKDHGRADALLIAHYHQYRMRHDCWTSPEVLKKRKAARGC